MRPGEWKAINITGDQVKGLGTKYDQDKSRVDLLDPDFLEDVGRVMGFGAQKYAEDNWRGGISIRRLIGAALRHTFALLRGDDLDAETGLSHAAHLGCCAMFIHWTLKNRPEMDNRYRKVD